MSSFTPQTIVEAYGELDELRRELEVVTNERDAALLKVSELEDRVHDLQELANEPVVVREPWHGQATS